MYRDAKDRRTVLARWLGSDKEKAAVVQSILEMDTAAACYCTGVLLSMLVTENEHYEAGVLLAKLADLAVT